MGETFSLNVQSVLHLWSSRSLFLPPPSPTHSSSPLIRRFPRRVKISIPSACRSSFA